MASHVKSHSKEDKSLLEWLCYLETLHTTEIDLGLARISQVALRLGIDLSFATVITVAGTNGKGTTCSFIENALLNETQCRNHQATQGLTVAVYSSPHIDRFNERLRINKTDVQDQAFIDAFQQIESVRAEISLSYYEYTTLAAFLVLMAIKPHIIILEVGLGGRLDATNIIDADIAVITSIDIDHQAFLGNDRETIGFEKAGIMRANQDIIIGDINPPQSVLAHANAINQQLKPADKVQALAKIQVREQHFTLLEQITPNHAQGIWQWQCAKHDQHNAVQLTNLQPTHIPRDNVATGLMVLKQLGICLTPEKVNKIIEQTKVPGRTEMFTKHCDIILDVAHNPHAGRYLARYLEQLKARQGYTKIHAVTAMLADKDIKNTLSVLASDIDAWYIAPLNVPRGACVTQMKAALSDFTNSINCFDNIAQAFKIAIQEAEANDLILVFGSFFTVAEIRKQLI